MSRSTLGSALPAVPFGGCGGEAEDPSWGADWNFLPPPVSTGSQERAGGGWQDAGAVAGSGPALLDRLPIQLRRWIRPERLR